MSAGEEASLPLPKGQLVVACMAQVCEAFNVTLLFPFVAFQVEDLGKGGPRLGSYVGLVASSFCLAQTISTYPWGLFSNAYGRKPALFLGVLGSGFGMLCFGLARQYWQAVAARLLGGVLNGNVGVLKCALTEMTDASNRGAAFAFMSTAWSAGTVVAPLLGGMLCRPASKYPAVFDPHGVFGRYPYLLPCLCTFVLNMVTALTVLAVLRETRNTCDAETAYSPLPLDDDAARSITENDDDGAEMGDSEHQDTALWKRTAVMMTIGNYGLLALAYILLDETLPLFLKLPRRSGGLAYLSSDIGVCLSIAGGLMFVFCAFTLPYLANGNKSRLFRVGCLGALPCALAFPALGQLTGVLALGATSERAVLVSAITLKNIFATLAFTAVIVQVNQSVSHEDELAAVNAMGQFAASLARGFGPAVGGLSFSLAVQAGDTYTNFVIVALLICAAMLLNSQLPTTVERGFVSSSVGNVSEDEVPAGAPIRNTDLLTVFPKSTSVLGVPTRQKCKGGVEMTSTSAL